MNHSKLTLIQCKSLRGSGGRVVTEGEGVNENLEYHDLKYPGVEVQEFSLEIFRLNENTMMNAYNEIIAVA